MDERICEQCKNPFFADVNNIICNQCTELLFDKVKLYIEENEEASMKQIIEDTGVAKKHIDQWIREGRLEAKNKAIRDEMEKLRGLQKDLKSILLDENNNQQENTQKQVQKFHLKHHI